MYTLLIFITLRKYLKIVAGRRPRAAEGRAAKAVGRGVK